MICSKCGKENPEGALQCAVCGALLTQAQPGAQPVRPARTSGLAIAALVLGILGLFTCGVTAVIGVVLGIIALVQISRSKGQLGGEVVAIVGLSLAGMLAVVLPITAAILYPVFARAREAAKTQICLANEHQLALAAISYANQHDGMLPPADKWSDAIVRYVKSRDAFVCPNARDRNCGYGFNKALGSRKLQSVRDPAGTVLIFESNLGWNGSGGRESPVPQPRHMQADNFAFADGHSRKCPRAGSGQLNWSP